MLTSVVTSSPRGPELFRNARSLPAANQDFVLDEPLKLTDGLLEVLLFAFLNLSLIDKHGFVHRIIEPLGVYRSLEYRAVRCLQAHNFGCERWIDRAVGNDGCRNEPLNWLEAKIIDQHDANEALISSEGCKVWRSIWWQMQRDCTST